jgi:hypothetical protein
MGLITVRTVLEANGAKTYSSTDIGMKPCISDLAEAIRQTFYFGVDTIHVRMLKAIIKTILL